MKWNEKYYRPAEAAAVGGINYATLRKFIERGQVVLTLFDRVVMISHSELLRLLAEKLPENAAKLEARDVADAAENNTQED